MTQAADLITRDLPMLSTTSAPSPAPPAPARPLDRYTPVAVFLHWLVAAAVIGQVSLGLWMVGLPDEPKGLQAGWFNVHKSTGMLLFALVLLRLAWRATHSPPPLPASVPRWQQHVALLTHRLMYLCLVLAPVSGFLGSSFSPYPVRFFGTALPRWTTPWPAGKQAMSAVHEAAVMLLIALIVLHVAAALWHASRGDGVFRRMTWRGSRR